MRKKINKISIALSIALVFLGMMGMGQSLLQQDTNYNWRTEINNPNADFKKIKQKAQSYFNNHPELDTTKGSGYKLYQRWKGFWNDRTTKIGDTNASFKYLTDAMNYYLQNKQQYISATDQSNWKLLGPTNDKVNGSSKSCIGLVTSIWADPNNINYILAGTNASGLWKTTDKGQHWINITDSYGIMNIGVEAIAVNPNNLNEIYIATGFENSVVGNCYDMGILKSTNGGQTWQQTCVTSTNPQNMFSMIKKILVNPSNSNIMYFASGYNVYKTIDGFNNIIKIFDGSQFFSPDFLDKKIVVDIAIPQANPNCMVISSNGVYSLIGNNYLVNTAELYRTLDLNSSIVNWTKIEYLGGMNQNYIPFVKLATNNKFPYDIFLAYRNSNSEVKVTCFNYNINPITGYYKTMYDIINSSWDEFSNEFIVLPNQNTSNQASNMQDFCKSFLGSIVLQSKYMKTPNLFISQSNLQLHNDVRALISINIPNTNNYIILAGTDGGIQISENYGESFSSINGEGLAISQFYALGNFESNEIDVIAGGVQDNGYWRYYNNKWENNGGLFGGDGVDVFFNDKNANFAFSTDFCPDQYLHFKNSNYIFPNGFSSKTINTNICRDQPIVFDPVNGNFAYNGTHEVFKISNSGQFSAISDLHTHFTGLNASAAIRRIAIAPTNPNHIYASFNGAGNNYKLVMTSCGGGLLNGNWNDITQSMIQYLQTIGITSNNNEISSITVSETDPNQLWVAFNGFSNSNSNPVARVLKATITNPNNIIWVDVSSGLPNFPVNCIRTLKGNSQNELFLANDMGVFYHNDNMTGNYWQPFHNTMPACIITDIEFNYRKNKIRVSTFGRGIWESDLPCQYESNTMIINNNTTWDAPKRIYQTIEVEPNAVLTIKSIVNMSSQAKIIVKPGAQLILDACVLNSACPGQLWKGIEVWGDYTKSQLPISNQGYVALRNGAIIKDAEIGIMTTSNPNITLKKRGGGIISAENAKFIDNKIAVSMSSYQNFSASNPAILNNDLSYFRFCNFETKGKLKDANVSFDAFVDLYNVNGIPFTSCTFVNPLEATNAFIGTGIRSANSSFRVNAECSQSLAQGCLCPEQYIVRSQFKNLQYGIKANNYNSGKIVTITESNFENNERGVYLNATKQAYITRNTVKVKDFHMPQTFVPYGIYLDFSTGYIFEGNSFDKASATNPGTVGLIINNSGTDLNMIYNNTFSNLYCATDAQNRNRSLSINPYFTGLKIKCNDYVSSNNFDIGITPNGCTGISEYQGLASTSDAKMPAGNTFSANAYQLNNGGEFFNYFHHASNVNNLILVPTNISGNITLQPTIPPYVDKTISCPAQALALNTQAALSANIISKSQQLNSAKLMLTIWVDGGNTPALKDAVNLSYPWEAFELYSNLISKSPYLSDEVLIDAIKREDVLPALMLKYILLANPQAVKSQKVWDALYHRNDPFPDAWIDELKQGADIVSPREQLEAQVSYYAQQRQLAVNELKYMYLSDSTAQYPTDSLIALLSTDIEATSDYQLAEYYMQKADFISCETILENIPSKYAYGEEEQMHHTDYMSYYTIIKDVINKDKDLSELSESQRNQLIALSETSKGIVSAYARSILSVVSDNYGYEEPVFLPDPENPLKSSKPENNQKLKEENLLKAFPNPANEFFIVEFNITERLNNARLEIIDATGRKLQSIELKIAKGQKMILTKEMAKGLYHCYLINDNKIIKQAKISKE